MSASIRTDEDLLALLAEWGFTAVRRDGARIRLARSAAPKRAMHLWLEGDALRLATASQLALRARREAGQAPGKPHSREGHFRAHVRRDEGAIDAGALMNAVACLFELLDLEEAPLPATRALARPTLPEPALSLALHPTDQALLCATSTHARLLGAPTFAEVALRAHALEAPEALFDTRGVPWIVGRDASGLCFLALDGRELRDLDDAARLGLWEPRERVRAQATSPDGRFVVRGGDDGRVRLEGSAGGLLGAWADGGAPVCAVAVTPFGDRVAAAFDDGGVVVRATPRDLSFLTPATPSAKPDRIRAVSFSDGSSAQALGAHYLHYLDARTGTLRHSEPLGMDARAMARDDHRTWLIGRDADGWLVMRTIHGDRVSLRVPAGPGVSVATSDTAIVIVDAESRTVRVHRLDGTAIRSTPTKWTDAIASPDGRWLAATGEDGVDFVRLDEWRWAADTARPIVPLALAPGADLVAVRTPEGALEAWELPSCARVLGPLGARVTCAAFGAAGERIAIGDGAGRVEVHDRLGAASAVLREAGDPVTALAFGPGGEVLAIGGPRGASVVAIVPDLFLPLVRERPPPPRGERDARGHEWLRIPAGEAWIGLDPLAISGLAEDNAELAITCAHEDALRATDPDDPNGVLAIRSPSPQHLAEVGDRAEHARRLGRLPARERVSFAAFEITRTAITNVQYAAFLDATGHPPPASWPSGTCPPGAETAPAASLRWTDAAAYAAWLGAALPTAREWEIAMRGGDGRLFPWGNAPHPRQVSLLSHIRDGILVPADAAHELASPFGVLGAFTVGGEWCADPWPDERRAVRGYRSEWVQWGTFVAGGREARVAGPGLRLVRRG